MVRKKSSEKEIRKKQLEIALCDVVAKTINETEETDYTVGDPEYQIAHCNEPVDVILESKSGSHPPRLAQVVTIPSHTQLELRDDNSNISKLESGLRKTLVGRKITGFEVHVHLTQQAELHGVPAKIVDRIADLIETIRNEGVWGMDDVGVWEYSEDVARYISDVSGITFSTTSVFVAAGRGCWIPLGPGLIEEGIRLKAGHKYSPIVSSSLMLVIGASSTIVQEQIDSYRRSSDPSQIPFAEAWIVPRFGNRAIPLKRRC